MTDKRRPRARADAATGEAGMDVWLPLLAAIVAAIVLLFPAKAETAPPRPIYDAARFTMTEAERTALEQHAAMLASIEADRVAARHISHRHIGVEVAALEPIAAPAPAPRASVTTRPTTPQPPALIAAVSQAQPGWQRLAFALIIAAMLGGALVMLERTWRRTGLQLSPQTATA